MKQNGYYTHAVNDWEKMYVSQLTMVRGTVSNCSIFEYEVNSVGG